MPTLIETRHQVEQNRLRDYENYVASVRVDAITFAAEALDSHLVKPLNYTYHDNELWSEQNGSLGNVFAGSIEYYRRKAEADPSLDFQYRRTLAEQKEYQHMLRMARGEAPNTFVAISPYPRELDGAVEDVEGYQSKRRLGFIRVITRNDDGSLQMLTHSFDQSDPQAIEAMYSLLGRSVDWSHDVLEQPVELQIDDSEARELLVDQLLHTYDHSLSQTQGGNWFAGRRPSQKPEAVAFIEQQSDLIDHHTNQLVRVGPKSDIAKDLTYDFVSALRRRFEGNYAVGSSVATEMSNAGSGARANGESVSGCGMTITTESQLRQNGYQIGKKEREWKYGTCQACLRDGTVGECNVCRDCEAADNRGVNLMTIQAKARADRTKKLATQALKQPSQEVAQKSLNKKELILRRYGKYAIIRQQTVFGGADNVVYDRRTNQELTRY